MKKISLISIILFLIVATTITKNSTKKIDKEIFDTKENIRLLKDKFELVLLEYNYLSSPKKIMDYQEKFFENDIFPNYFLELLFKKNNYSRIILLYVYVFTIIF